MNMGYLRDWLTDDEFHLNWESDLGLTLRPIDLSCCSCPVCLLTVLACFSRAKAAEDQTICHPYLQILNWGFSLHRLNKTGQLQIGKPLPDQMKADFQQQHSGFSVNNMKALLHQWFILVVQLQLYVLSTLCNKHLNSQVTFLTSGFLVDLTNLNL